MQISFFFQTAYSLLCMHTILLHLAQYSMEGPKPTTSGYFMPTLYIQLLLFTKNLYKNLMVFKLELI